MKIFLKGRDQLMQLALKNIKARVMRPKTGRKDMLGCIMSATEEKTGEPPTVPQTLVDAFTLLVGGTHTVSKVTGNTLHCLFANLARSPGSLERFVAEVDERLPPLKPDQGAYGITGLEEKLDFVNACIKENFRKDAVATFNMPRSVPPEGAMIDGHFVPGDTQCSVNIHAFHHNPAIWGLDQNLFNPNRYSQARDKDLSSLVMPFSVGQRNCVGQNLARTNVIRMATTLLRAYEFDFLRTEEPMFMACHGDSDLRTPVMVKVQRRGEVFTG
ncbi:hypothetical protein LTR02_017322 [Friedmanniomyces endolithicus]|uniref:Isotrichodermin C-15 hydroxylase n=1 Tax=Rachicladosporium monterosium TaxID=1507873 RepID=A0ABR0LGE8_9PEZI|nr:hypothetical protein LTR94_020291 [Friedmanniomyces endolithicus]KAK5147596.1 hypothetical protein LTR32_000971 [Rachicladosporium monterosium]KAK0785124.1 hypothetical protein LTR75_013617 [Friedmanniomyces endolithicus]KAK0887336.1 hypothetical protein LTR02_017322 [Friedmanniomyces endolithicus]KAK1078298.1 hypothetical protein LTR33_007354 [Friedmanniomyces endolithicus]